MSLPQSTAARIAFYMALSSDHFSPATGKTVVVTVSKNGSAFANPSAGATNATEIGSGFYYVDLSTTDTATLGPIVVLGTAASCDDGTWQDYVVNANTGGLAALPNAVAGAISGLWISDGSNNRLIDHCSTVSTVSLVSGAVGSVAGNVGGNLLGNVEGSVDGAVAGSVLGTVTLAATQNFNNTGQTTAVPVTGGTSGSGGNRCTITISNSTTSLPIAGASVWVTSDAAGATVVAGTLTTDASGEVLFMLTAGQTYYLWMTATGENGIAGQAFVASAD